MGIFFNSNIVKPQKIPYFYSGYQGAAANTVHSHQATKMDVSRPTLKRYYDHLKNDYLDILKSLKINLYELTIISKRRSLRKKDKVREIKVIEKCLKKLYEKSQLLRNRLLFFKKNIEDLKLNTAERQKILQKLNIIKNHGNLKLAPSSESSSHESSDSMDWLNEYIPEYPIKTKKPKNENEKINETWNYWKENIKQVSLHDEATKSDSSSSSSLAEHNKGFNSSSDASSASSSFKKPTISIKQSTKSSLLIYDESSSSSILEQVQLQEPDPVIEQKTHIDALRAQVYQDLEELEKIVLPFTQPTSISVDKEKTPSIKSKQSHKSKQLSAVKIVNYNSPIEGEDDYKSKLRNIDVKAFVNQSNKR